MSRTIQTPEALKAMFGTETDSDFIILLTITSDDTSEATGIPEPIRLCDGYTGRINSLTTDEEVVYGVTSRGLNYLFLPLQITLPTEEDTQAPRCTIVINDVTRYLTPIIRKIRSSLNVKLEIVLSTQPDTVQVYFDGFTITGITYNKDTVTADLSMTELEQEPFPVYKFTPQYFPGLF